METPFPFLAVAECFAYLFETRAIIDKLKACRLAVPLIPVVVLWLIFNRILGENPSLRHQQTQNLLTPTPIIYVLVFLYLFCFLNFSL
jgi:hypothetical protein